MTAPSAAPYLPFDGGRYRMAMGLVAVPPAAWFEVDDRLAADLALKRELFATRHGEVFAALPEATAAARELRDLMAEHLPRHHPSEFERDGARLVNRATGEAWEIDGALHPLDLAGRWVQEDLCLMQAGEKGGAEEGGLEEGYRLTAASLCSPSRWRLADKLGRPMAAIHGPVPGYADTLARPVDRFFAHLKPNRIAARLNWSILDDPRAFQPTGHNSRVGGDIAPAHAGERLWLRVERQTLRRLEASGAILFTIRTHVTPLGAAIADGRSAAELAGAVRGMPEPLQRYKSLTGFAGSLLDWLDRRAEGG